MVENVYKVNESWMYPFTAGRVDVSRNGLIKFCEEKGQRGKGTFSRRLCVLSGLSLRLYKDVKVREDGRRCVLFL